MELSAEGYRIAVRGWGNVNSVANYSTRDGTRGGSLNGGLGSLDDS